LTMWMSWEWHVVLSGICFLKLVNMDPFPEVITISSICNKSLPDTFSEGRHCGSYLQRRIQNGRQSVHSVSNAEPPFESWLLSAGSQQFWHTTSGSWQYQKTRGSWEGSCSIGRHYQTKIKCLGVPGGSLKSERAKAVSRGLRKMGYVALPKSREALIRVPKRPGSEGRTLLNRLIL
jgi:hypothetical protein